MKHITRDFSLNAWVRPTYSILTPTLDPWGGVKGQNIFFFRKVVMLHIELIGMEQRAPCKHIFYPNTHPRPPRVGSKDQNKLKILKVPCHVAYQIKGNEV